MIDFKGLRYHWTEEEFLSRPAAEYALERLWDLCAGRADWKGEPAVTFPAVRAADVDALLNLAPGTLPWLPLDALLPAGRNNPLDTDRLPALCRPGATATGAGWNDAFPLDLPAAAFLGLTRWEERADPGARHDRHGRALADHSIAVRQGFNDRPVLDEWALIVRARLEAARPGWSPDLPEYGLLLTHDVDRPLRYHSLWRVTRGAIGELVQRSRRLGPALREIRVGLPAWRDPRRDPYLAETRRQMERAERLGLRASFNIMTADPGPFDEGYDPRRSPYAEIVDEIRRRGHRIGWHPGYRTVDEPAAFSREKSRMDEVMGGARYGGRQHYLRWRADETWDLWEAHDLVYDSSIGWSDRGGFRSWTARAYPAFSHRRQCALRLLEEPLVLMDSAVASFGENGTYESCRTLLARARVVSGTPAVLIHNSDCPREVQLAIYGAVEEAV